MSDRIVLSKQEENIVLLLRNMTPTQADFYESVFRLEVSSISAASALANAQTGGQK